MIKHGFFDSTSRELRLRFEDLASSVHKSRLSLQNQPIDVLGLSCGVSLVQNEAMIYGYARVSTDGQSVDAQVKQLRAAGAEKVFRETASGAKTERRELARALRALDDGDTLLVTRLDRLARSTRDLLTRWRRSPRRARAFVPLATHGRTRRHRTGGSYSLCLGGLAEFERELIRARTGEGRERAKARGVHMGRPPKLTKHQKKEAIKRRDAGEPTREIARMFNVSHSTISRIMM